MPQGSILGPLLFLIYINDLQATSDHLKTVLFADDSNLLLRGTDLTTSQNKLNEELAKVSDFFKANKLKLNATKTKLVCFRKKSSNFNADDYQIFMDGVQLKFEEQASFLGITIDSHLTWEAHGNNVANKISRNSSMINRVKKILPPASLKILYSSFILPHLQYGAAIWGGYPTKSRKRIISIQKRIIRTITKSYFIAHSEPRLKRMKLLKFNDIYELQCLTYIHDSIYNRAPKILDSIVTREQEGHNYHFRNHERNPLNLKVPASRTNISKFSCTVQGPKLWNTFPNEFKLINQKHIFKSQIRNFTLNKYHWRNDCNNPRCRDHRHHT